MLVFVGPQVARNMQLPNMDRLVSVLDRMGARDIVFTVPAFQNGDADSLLMSCYTDVV